MSELGCFQGALELVGHMPVETRQITIPSTAQRGYQASQDHCQRMTLVSIIPHVHVRGLVKELVKSGSFDRVRDNSHGFVVW